MEFIKIGGKATPVPSAYEIIKKDIDTNESVSETGVLHKSRVRGGIYTIELNWRVSEDDLKTVTNALSDDSFQVVFFDPAQGGETTCVMYTGEQSFSCLGIDSGKSWWNVSARLIEF